MNRRELLRGLGVASASTLAWAFGCGGKPPPRAPSVTDEQASGEVRTWLRDAVERLAGTYAAVHVLAVTRQRTTAALDVLGTGVARTRRDGVVLVVRDQAGLWREQVSSDLTEAGVVAAVKALIGDSKKRSALALGAETPAPRAPQPIADHSLRERLQAIAAADKLDSRIVYASTLIDIEDSHVWSIAPDHDREQRLVRCRKHVLRAAWNGPRPVVSQTERAWTGGLDEIALTPAQIARTTELALEMMTPGAFEDKDRPVLLDPSVTAMFVDATVRSMLTSAASRRRDVQRMYASVQVAAPLVTLVDDPTTRQAYGGFVFDDEGVPAAPLVLIQNGERRNVLSDRAGGGRGRGRRPGHVGAVEPSPSHLRMAAGTARHDTLLDDGYTLEGATHAIVDASSARVLLAADRAREVRRGRFTGRVYADIELVGDLATLLGKLQALSSNTATIAYRDERDGEPRWRSIEAPWLRATGYLRARRRIA